MSHFSLLPLLLLSLFAFASARAQDSVRHTIEERSPATDTSGIVAGSRMRDVAADDPSATPARPAIADSASVEQSSFNGWRFAGMSAVAAGTLAATYLYAQDAWWKDGNTSFHFDDGADLIYSRNIDKLAHVYGGAIAADMFSDGLRWSGLGREASAWYGCGLSVFVQMVIEIKDGYSPRWGYSVWDVASGSLGSLFTTLKVYSPALAAFDVKFSYFRHTDKYFSWIKPTGTWNDDYINQTYWLSARMKSLLPKSAARWWPAWLALAAGFGVDESLNGYDDRHPDRTSGSIELYLALDVDVTKILPSDNGVWETVKRYLNYIKFPAPALRFTPHVIAFGLYF